MHTTNSFSSKRLYTFVLVSVACSSLCDIPLIFQNHSQKLADEIYNSLRGTLEPEFIGLLQSFICPKNNMIIAPESPPNMDENATKFELTDSLQVLPLQTGGKKKDPIFELFNPPANSKQGISIQPL